MISQDVRGGIRPGHPGSSERHVGLRPRSHPNWRDAGQKRDRLGQPRHRKIINVTSASGLIGSVGQGNYAAAKMGIVGLTKTWAKELGALNINVNAIAPAALTAMTEPLIQDPELPSRRLARFALGRYGTPEEIAPAFVFLASDESNYHHGPGPLCRWWPRHLGPSPI